MRHPIKGFALLLALLVGVAPPAAAQRAVTGEWLTEDGRASIRIGRCGQTICGRVAEILVPTPEGAPRDENNPDRNLRGRPVVGIMVISGFTREGDRFTGGDIYDPNTGRTYNARMELEANGGLRVSGCVLFGSLCRSETWRRR